MELKIIGGNFSETSTDFHQLNKYCEAMGLKVCLEWINGQYWLHSDDSKEKPISVLLDRELERHEEFFKQSSLVKDLVARAIGIKSGYRPKILDLTGGLLGDTLLFLSFGCEVVTLERNPIISLLIKSALENAQHSALKRLTFIAQDAQSYLSQNPTVEVIFFDPMFEDINEKALPKKEMRIFRSFVGPDSDAKTVYTLARGLKPKRLVVKRPRLSVPLLDRPHICFEGKATRYDVYLP